MPGNEAADKVHNFFEQGNSSQGQLPPVSRGNWPVRNSHLLVGNQRQIESPLISNSSNYSINQSDPERGNGRQSPQMLLGMNLTQLSLRPDTSRNQQVSSNTFVHGQQGFQKAQNQSDFVTEDRNNLALGGLSFLESQQGNARENGPALARTAERLEIAESPISFNILSGQQQLMRGQQPGMPQDRTGNQMGLNDMQIWQQQLMFKQVQELQRQQQLQQLDQGARELNRMNQLSAMARQASGDQLLINGTPVNDASNYLWQSELMGGDSKVPSTSQMSTVGNMNWVQRGGSSSFQGFPSAPLSSHEHGQLLRSTGFAPPQQLDQSLYGTPVVNMRGAFNQYSHLQGVSRDGADMFTKASGNRVDKPPMQSSNFNNAFKGEQSAAFQNQVNIQDGTLVSKQGFHGKNLLGQPSFQDLNAGAQAENFQQVNPLARNTPLQEFGGRQHQPGWSVQEIASDRITHPQNSVSLDPEEEKILFSSDDNSWVASIGPSGISGGYGNSLGSTECFNAFPSIQSGTWSALMQSAVAEASSSDTGLQDEWNGLGFQKAEMSSEHQSATPSDNAQQQKDWVDKTLHNVSSLTSRSFPLFDDSNMNSSAHSVSEYQQQSLKVSCEQSGRLRADTSLGSIQESPKESNQWFNQNSQQKPHIEGGHLGQPQMHLGNAWAGKNYEQLASAAHPRDMELNAQDMPGSWIQRQSLAAYSNANKPCSKPNDWNMNESLSANGDATFTSHDNGNTMQISQKNDLKIGMQMENDHDDRMWKSGDNRVASSISELSGGFEQVKSGSGSGSHPVNREVQHMNSGLSSNPAHTNQETNRQAQNNHHLDYGKHVIDSSMKLKGDDSLTNYQHQLNKRETSNDSYNSNQSHHTVTGMRENSWLNASDSCSSGSGNQKSVGQGGRKTPAPRRFQYHPMGNVVVNVEPSDTIKQVRHSQGLQRQVLSGSNTPEHGPFAYSKIGSHVSNNATDMEQGHVSETQENVSRSSELPSRGIPQHHESSVLSSDGSAGYYDQNRKPVQACQNMLELLHKVDQSRENNTHFVSSDRIPVSEMPEAEASDASVSHFQQSQSTPSQGFGLRLAPPSQRVPAIDRAFSSQSSSPTVRDLNSRHVDFEVGDKGRTPASVPSLPHENLHREHWENKSGQMSNEISQSKSATLFTSSLPYQRNQVQHQQLPVASEETIRDQQVHVSFDRLAPHIRQTPDPHNRMVIDQSVQTSQPGTASKSLPLSHTHPADRSQFVGTNSSFSRVSGQQLPVLESVPISQPSSTSVSQQGAFSTNSRNVWNNISNQQVLAGAPHRIPSNLSQSLTPSRSNLERTSWLQKQAGQASNKLGNVPEFGSCSTNSQRFTHAEEQPGIDRSLQSRDNVHQDPMMAGKDSAVVPRTETTSRQNHTSSSRDIEAFGQSLRQSPASHQNYSLLQQVQAMKGVGSDPNIRDVKRFKGSDCGSDAQQVSVMAAEHLFDGHSATVRDVGDNEPNAATVQKSFSSRDGKSSSLSSQARDDQYSNSPSQLVHGDVSSQDMCNSGRNNPQNYSSHLIATSARSENPHVNPRMAPSWFEQYGTFKNGKLLPTYDQRTTETAYQRFFSGKPSENLHSHTSIDLVNADASQISSGCQSTATALIASESFSPQTVPLEIADDQSLTVMRTKKRKNEALGLLPWHKEVTDGTQRIINIRLAEQEWAQAANRLVEKVEDDVDMAEDGQPILRPRRRIILTTQLMQQLFRAAPSAVLASDATKYYETVTYFTAKLQLGEACSLMSSSGSNSCLPTDNGKQTSGNVKTSGRMGADQYFSKAVEEFIGKARKLETDLLRLDRRCSILDLRVECQELEKFSVINRFAKFHGRGQADGGETSSSSDPTMALHQKVQPQRYVTAASMPRNLPQGVQCLSL